MSDINLLAQISELLNSISQIIGKLVDFVWGPYLLQPLLLGVGAFLMIGLGFMPLFKLGLAIRTLWHSRIYGDKEKGELSPWQALMTSMAATIGTGNIVGVATAVLVGGPGAVFWMWCTALVGMATKFCETVLAVQYREVTPAGSYVGGPMYYIKNGLGKNWMWLAFLFALFGCIACFGPGNLTQAHAIASNLQSSFHVPTYVTAIILFVLVGTVLLGGVKRVGAVAGKVVPFMAFTYIFFGIIVIFMHAEKIPEAFSSIFTYAFTPYAVGGGAAGVAITKAIQMGVSRGLFSNEAGLGTGPIAHATAITNSPIRQGFLGMLDPFIDTIIVCTITAMVILVSGQVENMSVNDAALLTAKSFETALPGTFGKFVISGALIFFAFTTILGWAVYGERCAIYLFGYKASKIYRLIFTCVVPVGATNELTFAWGFSDLFNGLMAIPNLIALALLSPVVFKLTKQYFADLENKAAQQTNQKLLTDSTEPEPTE